MREILVALAGSPNVGKSTLFNRITGGNVHVANWAGVTLQRYEGSITYSGRRLRIVDLPGTYSLSARDLGERVALDFIVNEKPDVLVVVADATELEKSLYLAVEAMELYGKVVIALNMIDAAEKRGIHINFDGLERSLGVPVVPISALKGIGIGKLMRAILEVAEGRAGREEPLRVDYNGLERYIAKLSELDYGNYPARWAALKVLEGSLPPENQEAERICEEARRDLAIDPLSLIIASRHEFVDKLVRENVKRVRLSGPSLEERLDRFLLHPLIGPIVSILLISSAFFIIFTLNTGFPFNMILRFLGMEEASEMIESYSLVGLLGSFFDMLAEASSNFLSSIGLNPILVRFISEGVIGSLGALLSFVPILILTYVVLGALEDSGLFPRAATVLDSVFRKFGLSGRAFFPALIGIGCNVPGIIATRGIEDERERTIVGITEPFIPCQARLVVLLAISLAAFSSPLIQASLMLSIYILGILMFLLSSKLLRTIMGWKELTELLMELPPYHRPSLRVIWWYSKANVIHFLRKAGLIILLMSSLTWLILNMGPSGYVEDPSNSFAFMLGNALTPILSLAGLGDWRYALALEVGFIAKEGLLSTFSQLAGSPDPVSAIRYVGITPLKGISLALIMSFYVPCLATISTMLSELRKLKYVALAIILELSVSFILASISYNLGSALGLS
ncbi:ferrous iron transport protein B [Candidatus Korarchaeum cryptofilum]|uniref:Ferrous iron transport protein B n=1 Tax=Korarchaeum cryptofilum (strain OPF8) TaxID=374847 RepID=B1L769_KORCO|nr:ferrous iron transport protein B [Candidatus Korarchaeum cryptofilum]ACB08298.1 ferrous iron transport protein B [Candidatus Korarchaeum cryptofilum OPF8]